MDLDEAIRERNRSYYLANKDRLIAQTRAYREANRVRVKAQARAYYRANRSHIITQAKEYYRENREYVLAKQKASKAANPEEHQIKNKAMKARRLQANADPILDCSLARMVAQAVKDQKKILERITGQPHHIDHIIPLCLGGTGAPWNLRAITAEENLSRPRQTFAG